MMRSTRVFGLAIVVATVAGAWAGCSGDEPGTNPGAGGSASSATVSSSSGMGPVGVGGAGGKAMLKPCDEALEDDFNLLEACEPCLEDNCCTEVSECAAIGN